MDQRPEQDAKPLSGMYLALSGLPQPLEEGCVTPPDVVELKLSSLLTAVHAGWG